MLPSEPCISRVSPVVEKCPLDPEAKGDDDDHQSSPANEPPSPTVPIFEKSTCGNADGAEVDAMASGATMARARGRRRGDIGGLRDIFKDAREGKEGVGGLSCEGFGSCRRVVTVGAFEVSQENIREVIYLDGRS
jgi:hypothetical protein